MARPKIGIFGALVAVGGMLAWRWAQKHRASQAGLNRELSRWESEGGTVTTPQTAPLALSGDASGVAVTHAPMPAVRNGNGAGEPWPFPHGAGEPLSQT